MKAWVKVLVGLGVGAVIGGAAALLGKKHGEDEDYVEVEETEDYDSDSDDEAE